MSPNMVVFVCVGDMGVKGDEPPSAPTMTRIKQLRGKTAQLIGMCKDRSKAGKEACMLPLFALVSAGYRHQLEHPVSPFCHNTCHDSNSWHLRYSHDRIHGIVINQPMTTTSEVQQVQHSICGWLYGCHGQRLRKTDDIYRSLRCYHLREHREGF